MPSGVSSLQAVSIILCKWANRIQVYFDLYLNSVLKYKHKLIHNQSPIRNRHRPFFLNSNPTAVGEYKVILNVTDKYNRTTRKEIKLNVWSPEIVVKFYTKNIGFDEDNSILFPVCPDHFPPEEIQKKFRYMETMKFYTEEEILDKHIGKKGTLKRDQFEADLNSYLIGGAIKKARLQQNLTQEELGNLIGVQRAQISRIENGKNLTFSTIAKVFKAMGISAKLEIGTMDKVALW